MRLPYFVKYFGRVTLKNRQINKLFDRYMSNFYNRIMGRSPPQDIWFDDGYVEDYTIIYPLLNKYNVTGTLAIITSRVGKPGFLNINQLKIMMREGWKVASHSVTHRDFKRLTFEEADWELQTSKEWIEKNLGVTPLMFMPPYGLHAITRAQKQHVLSYYPTICAETQHFHSRHFRLDWIRQDADFSGTDANWNKEVRQAIAEYERKSLMKILQNIELNSGYFKCNKNEIKVPHATLPLGYTVRSMYGSEANKRDKTAWEALYGKKWHVPNDGYVFFLEFNGNVIGTYFVVYRDGVGTFHSSTVDEEHRRKGLYRYMTRIAIQHLINEGITEFEIQPAPILWNFWRSLGFRKVYTISSHSKSGAFS